MSLASALSVNAAVQRRLGTRLSPGILHASTRTSSFASRSPSSGSSAPAQPYDAGLQLFGEKTITKKKDLGEVSVALAGQFYQRSLPSAQVPFASAEGRRLFREALADGHMENYFFLAEQFRTQDEPTFCGLTTLAMVLNCLRIDPMQTWKGVWRWISEDMLSCCMTPEKVREEGMSFDMFRSLALCQGAQVDSHRAPPERSSGNSVDSSDPQALEAFADSFRNAVRSISQSAKRECLVICYSRERLGQTGAGHFSPVGGYHAGSDSVLILDVARFKYPPHWTPVRGIAEAMAQVDPATGRPRGFLHLCLQDEEPEWRVARPLFVPFVPAAAGRRLVEALTAALASQCSALAGEPATTVAVRRWLHAASTVEPQVLKRLLQVGDADALQEVLLRLAQFPLYQELCDAYSSLVSSGGGFKGEFPPLRLNADGELDAHSNDELALGLATYGELWVLLLLLLPQHLRSAVSEEVGSGLLPHTIANTVRGPWALPLEALRETLGQSLPARDSSSCWVSEPS